MSTPKSSGIYPNLTTDIISMFEEFNESGNGLQINPTKSLRRLIVGVGLLTKSTRKIETRNPGPKGL